MNFWHPQTNEPDRLAFHLMYSIERQREELRVMTYDRFGKQYIPIVKWQEKEAGHVSFPCLLSVPDYENPVGFQNLFNALWDAGYRPPQASRQDAVVEAKNENLTDLRNIINKLLETE